METPSSVVQFCSWSANGCWIWLQPASTCLEVSNKLKYLNYLVQECLNGIKAKICRIVALEEQD